MQGKLREHPCSTNQQFATFLPTAQSLSPVMQPPIQYHTRMNTNTFVYGQENQSASDYFDLFRLCRSKDVVDLSPNTLRSYNKQGLPFHRQGKVVFVSRRELSEFIRRVGDHTGTKKANSAN